MGGSTVHGEGWGPHNRTRIVDAETLQPQGEPFDITAHNVIPIGDGSTAMVQEISSDFASVHWRVIDVSTGEVDVLSEGDVKFSVNAFGCLSGRLDGRGGGGHRRDRHHRRLDRRRTAAIVRSRRPVLWLNYSDDGELLVSGADDGGVSLWDATTLDLLGTVYPPHHGDPVPAGAQFIGDTHDVAIASNDGKVYRWETDLDRAIDFACQMAGRNLTDEEWEEFLPAQPYREVCPRL